MTIMMRAFQPLSTTEEVPVTDLPVTLSDIKKAASRIDKYVMRTPLIQSSSLSAITGQPVYLKLETRQPIMAFKLRGAINAILSLDDKKRKQGLVTASTGNHGRAVAYAARELGLKATICMSALVPTNKVNAIRELDAEICITGISQDDAQHRVAQLVVERSLISIPPFDDVNVVAGQGTIGLEIIKDLPDLHTILIPLSGGGLAGGIAVAIKTLRPKVRIIGISMQRGAAMEASIRARRPVEVTEEESLADSLGGGIGLTNKITFPLCNALLDEIILLTEAEIAAGIRHAMKQEGEIVEGAGAVGIAALLSGKTELKGPTAIVISGGNIDPVMHQKIVDGAIR